MVQLRGGGFCGWGCFCDELDDGFIEKVVVISCVVKVVKGG